MINVISDYSKFIKNPYLLNQFIGNPETQVQELLAIVVPQSNAVEAALNGLLSELQLANAIGLQLDKIGLEVGLNRNGLNDNDYKNLLYIQIFVNTGGGCPENILEILRSFSISSNINLTFLFPAKIEIFQDSSNDEPTLRQWLIPVIPSGVGLGIGSYIIDNNGNNIVDNNGNKLIGMTW